VGASHVLRHMSAVNRSVNDAVILMAGSGSRLNNGNGNSDGSAMLKPLVNLLGRPLISYTFESLAECGITRIHAVVGFEAERLTDAVRELAPPGITLQFIHNSEWEKQNGVSLVAAARVVHQPFILTMADHLFDRDIVKLLMRDSVPNCLTLAIDRKIDSIFDLPDAMKVQTRRDRLSALGKELEVYDAIDSGLFFCPAGLFDQIKEMNHGGNYSLADVVREMAAKDRARVIDIGPSWWQDVDTPEMLEQAKRHLRTLAGAPAAAQSIIG
jgi:choline kinase